jgi:hypothetical protein
MSDTGTAGTASAGKYLTCQITPTLKADMPGIEKKDIDITISDNMIKNVVGQDAHGIKFSQSVTDCAISSNEIYTVLATAGAAFGIYAHDLTSTVIGDNQLSGIVSTAALVTSAAIGCMSSSASWANATIVGNNVSLTDDGTAFLEMNALNFNRSSVTGNTCYGTSKCFIEVNTPIGGAFDNNSISGNTAHGLVGWAIYIDARSGTVKSNMSISGNDFHVTVRTPIAAFLRPGDNGSTLRDGLLGVNHFA